MTRPYDYIIDGDTVNLFHVNHEAKYRFFEKYFVMPAIRYGRYTHYCTLTDFNNMQAGIKEYNDYMLKAWGAAEYKV